MKSPSSIRNERLNTSKCRGKFQKMEVLYTHSPKMPGSSQTSQKKGFKKIKIKLQKRGSLQSVRLRAVVAYRPWRGPPFLHNCHLFFQTPAHSLGTCGQLLLVDSSPCPPCLNFTLKLQTSIIFDL
jgi:hypothetical protein